jgi:hypothetical protein
VSIGGWAYSQGSDWANFNPTACRHLAVDLGASRHRPRLGEGGRELQQGRCVELQLQHRPRDPQHHRPPVRPIRQRGVSLGISVAGWSTGAYYVKGTPFEEGKVQWGSGFGGVMYNAVKTPRASSATST